MATFAEVGLCDQLVANVFGLVRNWRDNASGYKAALVAGTPAEKVAAIVLGDAGEYARRLKWMADLVIRSNKSLDDALATRSLTRQELDGLMATLNGLAAHSQAATLKTFEDIDAEADYVLATAPNFERIW